LRILGPELCRGKLVAFHNFLSANGHSKPLPLRLPSDATRLQLFALGASVGDGLHPPFTLDDTRKAAEEVTRRWGRSFQGVEVEDDSQTGTAAANCDQAALQNILEQYKAKAQEGRSSRRWVEMRQLLLLTQLDGAARRNNVELIVAGAGIVAAIIALTSYTRMQKWRGSAGIEV
jgi:hypothetical protein